MSPPPVHRALRPIAIIEALKGAVVLVAGFGLLSFLGRDAEVLAEQIVRHLDLDPTHHYPQVFIAAVARLKDGHLWALAGLAAIYAAVRFAEAYGLWHGRRWAEWLAALSGAIYVPFEVFELIHRASWIVFGVLVLNLVIVAYMTWLLTENLRKRAALARQLIDGP